MQKRNFTAEIIHEIKLTIGQNSSMPDYTNLTPLVKPTLTW